MCPLHALWEVLAIITIQHWSLWQQQGNVKQGQWESQLAFEGSHSSAVLCLCICLGRAGSSDRHCMYTSALSPPPSLLPFLSLSFSSLSVSPSFSARPCMCVCVCACRLTVIGSKCSSSCSLSPVDFTHLESVIQHKRMVQPFHIHRGALGKRRGPEKAYRQSCLSLVNSRHRSSKFLLLSESLYSVPNSAIVCHLRHHCLSGAPLFLPCLSCL